MEGEGEKNSPEPGSCGSAQRCRGTRFAPRDAQRLSAGQNLRALARGKTRAHPPFPGAQSPSFRRCPRRRDTRGYP